MKLMLSLALAALGSLALIAPALAAPAVTETNHYKNVTESFTDLICEGGPLYDITITYNGVEHVTVKDGTVHVTFTQTGKFTATDPGTGEVVTGSFTIWGGFNATLVDPDDPDSDIVPGTPAQGTFTFSARGRGDAGTRVNVHEVEHFNVTPGGSVNELFHGHGC